jgi:hypothetical protein
VFLFSESATRAVVVVARSEELRFTEMCAARGFPTTRIGVVDSGGCTSTMTSNPPKRPMPSDNVASHSRSSLGSSSSNCAHGPSSWANLVPSATCDVWSAISTWAPSSTKARQTADPMVPAPPTTNAMRRASVSTVSLLT